MLLVVAQKSGRSTVSDSRSDSPSLLTKVRLDLRAKGRVGQHHVVVDAGMGPKAVIHGDVGLVAADAAEIQVHHT